MEKIEAQYKSQGGDRNQLHNVYKVPTANKIALIQKRAYDRIASIELMFRNKLLSLQKLDDTVGLGSETLDSKAELVKNKKMLIEKVRQELNSEISKTLNEYRKDLLSLLSPSNRGTKD